MCPITSQWLEGLVPPAHLTFSDVGVASDHAQDVALKARVLSPRINLMR